MGPFSLLDWIQGGEPSARLTVRLYTLRSDPIVQPVVDDFVEATYPGYVRFPFPPAASSSLIPGSGAGVITIPNAVFSVAISPHGGELIMGFFCVALREDDSQDVFAWRDLAAETPMQNSGDQIGLSLTVTAQQYVIP